jgi:signal transduction histidine kinase
MAAPTRTRFGTRANTVLFAVVVTLCLTQVGWWIYFQVGEAGRLERAGDLLARGDIAAAARELGAAGDTDLRELARRRRVMFLSEGIALSVLVLAGVVFFYLAIVRAERAGALQERFLTGATHELKTPLASVRLGLESLRAGTLPKDKHAGYVQAMLCEVDRLERGLSNLLAVAGLRTSPARPVLAHSDVADDVRASIAALAERAATAQIAVHAAELPALPMARDADALRVALGVVLDNAVKFSPAGSRIDVALQRVPDGAVISVQDQGIGVAHDDVRQLGARFYRGRNATHRGGTGLGLFLARELLARSGGELAVHSAGEGRGCRVEIRLRGEGARA